MLKALIVSSAVVGSAALASPALADIYVNPEFNGGAYGNDWLGGTLNLDVGFEGSSGAYSYYIQGGPAVVMPDGEDQELERWQAWRFCRCCRKRLCLWRAERHDWR